MRAGEIGEAVLDRLHASDTKEPVRDLEYLQGLTAAVRSGVEYGIEVIAVGDERAGPAPLPLLMQARLAARHRIPLQLMIRRYMSAKLIVSQFVIAEAATIEDLPPAALGAVLSAQECAFERLVAAASDEFEREVAAPEITRAGRLAERVRRLLDGEAVDPSPLEYDLSVNHLALVARSAEVTPLLRKLSGESNALLLAVTPGPEETWAWLGARRPLDANRVVAWIEKHWPASVQLGIGEPGEERRGWRRSHGQAREAVGLSRAGGRSAVRYRDVALAAAAAKDPLLLSSLWELYLLPLGEEKDGDPQLRRTLRAYFASARNGSCAAVALGISRQTVGNHLRNVEECIGLPLAQCGDALATALCLEELGHFTDPPDSSP